MSNFVAGYHDVKGLFVAEYIKVISTQGKRILGLDK